MNDEIEIIHSPLEQTYSAEGHTLHILIYRSEGESWMLEIEDELGSSTVWNEPFDSDTVALAAALAEIETEGVHQFVIQARLEAQANEAEMLNKLTDESMPPSKRVNSLSAPLSEDELDELEHILLYDIEADEGMTLDMLDGYLHAIVMGPEIIMPQKWLPNVWGQEEDASPAFSDLEQFNHFISLVMRHYNSIVAAFESNPPDPMPLWSVRLTDMGEFEDAETWAYGFCEGIKLNPTAWQALFDDPKGKEVFRPIGLLGEEDYTADQDDMIRTPEQRHALSLQIPDSLRSIHAFWSPLRQAIVERQTSQRLRSKVGRNEPCPCGSGKKFKKCCGMPSELH